VTLAIDFPSSRLLNNGQYQLEAVEYQTAFLTSYRAIALPNGRSVRLQTWPDGYSHPCETPVAAPSLAPDRTEDERPRLQQQFLAAAQHLTQIAHPHLAQVLDTFTIDDRPYIVVAPPSGVTLAERLQTDGPFTEADAIQIVRQVGSALVPLHAAGILHWDIQPQNVVWDAQTQQAVLTHLSWARLAFLAEATPATEWFAPGYTALEQYLPGATATPATDLYALAATLYTLVTGQVPIAAIQRDRQPLVNPRQLRPDLSPIVEQIILQGMEINPRLRPQDLGQWLALLPQRSRSSAARSLVLPKLTVTPAPRPPARVTAGSPPPPRETLPLPTPVAAANPIPFPPATGRSHRGSPKTAIAPTLPAATEIQTSPRSVAGMEAAPVNATAAKAALKSIKSKRVPSRSQRAASPSSRFTSPPVYPNSSPKSSPPIALPSRFPSNRRLFQGLLVASAAAAFFGGGFGLTLRFAGDRGPMNSRLLQPNQSFPPQTWPGEADAAQFDFSNLPATGESPRWEDPVTPAQPTWPLEEESAFPPPPVTRAPIAPDPALESTGTEAPSTDVSPSLAEPSGTVFPSIQPAVTAPKPDVRSQPSMSPAPNPEPAPLGVEPPPTAGEPTAAPPIAPPPVDAAGQEAPAVPMPEPRTAPQEELS